MSTSPPTGTISQEYQQYNDGSEPVIYQVYLLRLLEKALLIYQNKMTEDEYQAPFDPSGVISGTTREVTEQPLNALGFHLPSFLSLYISNDLQESATVAVFIPPEMLPHLKVGHVVYYLTQLFQQQRTFRRQGHNHTKKVGDALFDAQRNPLARPKGHHFANAPKHGAYMFYFQSTDNADKDFFNHINEIQSYQWPEATEIQSYQWPQATDMYDWLFNVEYGFMVFTDFLNRDVATGQIKRVEDPVEDWRNTVKTQITELGIPEENRVPLSVFTEYEIKLAIALRKVKVIDFKDFYDPLTPYVKEEEVDEEGNVVLVDRPVTGEEALRAMPADEVSFVIVTAYLRKKGLL